VDGKEVSRLRSQGVKNQGELLSILKMNKSGEFLIRTQFAKHQNASSHYMFTWMVNHTADYIEFNFSIPKFIYGSNVLNKYPLKCPLKRKTLIEHKPDKGLKFTCARDWIPPSLSINTLQS